MPDYVDKTYRAARGRDLDYAPPNSKKAGDRNLYKKPGGGIRGVENQATIRNQKGKREEILRQGFFRKPVTASELSGPANSAPGAPRVGQERLHAVTPWRKKSK